MRRYRTRVMLPKRSCPAISHSCSLMTFPSSQRMIFSAKSAPAPPQHQNGFRSAHGP